jgi:hypothetical protein
MDRRPYGSVSLASGAVAHVAIGGDAGNDKWSSGPVTTHAHASGAAV